MNWIDEKMDGFKIDNSPRGRLIGLLGAINCDIAKPWVDEAINEARTQGAQEALAKVEEWVKENEYCSKCCSPKKYCPDWGKFASATETTDLLHHLQQLKDNKVI